MDLVPSFARKKIVLPAVVIRVNVILDGVYNGVMLQHVR